MLIKKQNLKEKKLKCSELMLILTKFKKKYPLPPKKKNPYEVRVNQ